MATPLSAYGSASSLGGDAAPSGGFNIFDVLNSPGAAPKRRRSFGHVLASDITHTVTGIIPGTIGLLRAGGSDLIHHSVPAAIYDVLAGHGNRALNDLNPATSQLAKKIVIPMARSEYSFYSHPLRNIEEGHILTPIFDAAALTGLVGGRIAALGLTPEELGTAARTRALVTGRYGGEARTITAELPSGETQLLRTLPRSGYRAKKAMLVESGLRKTFGESGLQVGGRTVGSKLGTLSRATKAAQKAEDTQYLKTISDPRVIEWQKAFKPLSVEEREAFHVKARTPATEDLQTWKEILANSDQPSAKQLLKTMDKPEVMKLHAESSPKLQRALDAWHGISEARQEILLKHGAIDPYGIEEGRFRHTMMMRGAQVLTKSKAYNGLRAIDAKITEIKSKMGVLPAKGAKVGQAEVRAQIAEGRRASAVAIKSRAQREKYHALAQETEDRLTHARTLRQELRDASVGKTSNETLQRLGIEVPSSQPSSFEGIGSAFTKAEITRDLKKAQQTVAKLDKTTADPEWKPKIDKQIEDLQAQYDAKDPVRQKVWRQRLGDQLAQLKQRRKSLNSQAGIRKGYEERIAKHQKDLSDLEGGTLVSRPLQDVRMEALGKLQDLTGKAYDAYERALTAEQAHQEASMRGLGAAAAQREATKGLSQAREDRLTALQGLRVKYHELLDARHELLVQRDHLEMLRARVKAGKGPLVGGPRPEELATEFEQRGFAQPGYLPDVPATAKSEFRGEGQATLTPPRPQADVYPTTGALMRHGMLDVHSDPLTPALFRAAKHARQSGLYQWALRAGRKIGRDEAIPEGWEPVRAYRGQTIPATLTGQAEHVRQMNPFDALNEDEFDKITVGKGEEGEEATVDAAGNPDPQGAYRVIVPKAVADRFRADFGKSTTLGSRLVRNATNVWRALLLKTRIGWLENNIIGNTILAAVRFAGVNGLKSYLNLIANMAGPKKALELLNMPVTRKGLTDAQFAEVIPEALRTSYIETNLPGAARLRFASGVASKAERAGKGALNLLPRADRWYETFLRKGAVETTLRGLPEVRAIYDAMPKGEKNWGDAMVQAMEKHPEIQPMVVREMNDALGDFMSMTPFERNQVRQLVPFYTWFREITKITAKMLYDTPERAKLLQMIGQVGATMTPQEVPSYLQGGYPVHVPSWLGGSNDPTQQTIISTRAMAPWSTVIDEGSAAASLLAHGNTAPSTRPFVSMLNPALAAAFNLQRPQKIGFGFTRAPILQPLVQTIANLPEYRVGFGPQSGLYPTRGLVDKLLQQMGGSPIRTYDITQAQGRQGQ